MKGRWFLLACAGLVVVRMALGAHAPAAVDAHACLAALALALVSRAPRAAIITASLVVAGVVASIVTSWDPWISLLALPAAIGPAAFFVLAASGSCRQAFLAGVGVGGALNAVAALIQRVYTWPDALRRMDELGLDAAAVQRLSEARPLGLSVSPDLAGGLCLAGAFCALALALEVKDRRQRLALVALAACSASGLLLVRSFGTALALVAGVGACALAFALGRSRKLGVIVAGVGAGAGALALGVAFAVRGADALARSAGERLLNWESAVALFVDHPVLGVGYMRFPAGYLLTREPGSNLTRYAHSTPLEHLAETGLVGGVLAAAALVVAARAIWTRRATLGNADVILLGAAAAAAVRLVVDYDGHVAQSASVVAVVTGLLLAEGEPAPAPPLQRRVTAALALLSLALVFLLGARQSLLENALDASDDTPLESWVRTFPFDVEPRLALGKRAVDALSACTQQEPCALARARALEALDPACARAHPPSAAFLLRARARLPAPDLPGDVAAALADADRALAVDPGNAGAHQLGIALARAQGLDDTQRVAAAERWGVTPP